MSTGATRKRQVRAIVTLDSVDSSPWPQPPRDLELSVVWIDGEELAVLSHPLDEPVLEGLSEAERQIAEEIVDGLSNAQILSPTSPIARPDSQSRPHHWTFRGPVLDC